jgi:hypothetical protein
MTILESILLNSPVEAPPPADLDLEFKSPHPHRSRGGNDMLQSYYLHLCNALEWSV